MTQTLANTYLPPVLRLPKHISPLSGMCASCSVQCPGLCEIGLSAIRGPETVQPYETTAHQFAAEKNFLILMKLLISMADSLILLMFPKHRNRPTSFLPVPKPLQEISIQSNLKFLSSYLPSLNWIGKIIIQVHPQQAPLLPLVNLL